MDLLIEGEIGMVRIQVKTKQRREWPNCTGIFGDNIVLVFVDHENKTVEERPDFYILTPNDWESLVKIELGDRISKGEIELNNQKCPIWVKQPSYKGMGVLPRQITEHKECWEKIEALVRR